MRRYAIPYDQWTPDIDVGLVPMTDLAASDVFVWKRQPMLVLETPRLIPFSDWPAHHEATWNEAGQPDPATWEDRPYWVDYRHHRTGRSPVLGNAPASYIWHVLPEHYPICRRCGELPPCSETFTEQIMTTEITRMAFEPHLTHGMCHGCGWRVTGRDSSILFHGDNLTRPDLGPNTAVFHTSSGCLQIALAYQQRWLTAAPDRTPRIHAHQ